MYYISSELDSALLQKMIKRFTLNEQPKLEKWKNYYDGKHKILRKVYSDPTKVINRIVTNFCKVVADTYSGYIVGKPLAYTSNEDIAEIQEVINYNDSDAEDQAWMTNALIYGRAYELHWIDKEGKTRYSQINPQTAFPVYSNTLDAELLYFVRWFQADDFDDNDIYHVEVYSKDTKTTYKSVGINGQLELIAEDGHFFGDVPVSVFDLNEDRKSIFDSIITLNDAYNELQSCEVDDYGAFVDAYLLLTNCDAGDEEIAGMKESRVLILPENGSAQFITKNANDTQVENMLTNIQENIFKISCCPDLSDESFAAQSGIAIQYRILGFENIAAGIVNRFTKAIQRRIELICNVLQLKASEAVWRDISIQFTRNLPIDYTETVGLVNGLKGIVSDSTLLAQLDFITDVEAELEAIAEQKESEMNLFSFGFDKQEEDDVNE